jgi:HSP20 family molecular chaperone IbpA
MPTFRAGFAHPLEELRDEVDRLWTSLTAAPPLRGQGSERKGDGVPAVNIAETDDSLTIEAELPGLEVGEVEIAVTGDELMLKRLLPERSRPERSGTGTAAGDGGTAGNGEPQSERHTLTWHRRERGNEAFDRRIVLPVAVDAARVEARLVDGVLTVTCPKAAEAQPHRVPVRSA